MSTTRTLPRSLQIVIAEGALASGQNGWGDVPASTLVAYDIAMLSVRLVLAIIRPGQP